MSNLLISYDLREPEKNYDPVIAAIKALGPWAAVHKSFWYVKTSKSADEALVAIRRHLTVNDTVLVADASRNYAAWHGLSDEVTKFLQDQWSRR